MKRQNNKQKCVLCSRSGHNEYDCGFKMQLHEFIVPELVIPEKLLPGITFKSFSDIL